ncbi:hypothetical protein HMPREF9554_01042 [Treponema phagedenis F0421]|nr:hypothetical protein HMPREF9554_01042 [Treponema phagedenis F0421]
MKVMKNFNALFIFGLGILIPATSYFAYGILLFCVFWLLFFAGILSDFLITLLELKKTARVFSVFFIFSAAVFCNTFLETLFPILQLSLSLYVYFIAGSYVLTISLNHYKAFYESFEFPLTFSLLLLILSLIRELLGFGTISLPVPSGFLLFNLLPFTVPVRFLASSAGAFMLTGVLLWVYRTIKRGEILPFENTY